MHVRAGFRKAAAAWAEACGMFTSLAVTWPRLARCAAALGLSGRSAKLFLFSLSQQHTHTHAGEQLTQPPQATIFGFYTPLTMPTLLVPAPLLFGDFEILMLLVHHRRVEWPLSTTDAVGSRPARARLTRRAARISREGGRRGLEFGRAA